MSTLTATFRTILNGLKSVIATIAAKDRPRTQFLLLIWTRLTKTTQRFETLVAHWRAGTLPKQRTRPAARPRRPSAGRTPRPQALPASQSWMLRHVDHSDFRAHASQLQHFLTTEECKTLLAEVPRAARILRPLARALGLQMPGDPPPPLPKPAPKPKNPWLALPPIIGIVIHRDPPDPYPPILSKAR